MAPPAKKRRTTRASAKAAAEEEEATVAALAAAAQDTPIERVPGIGVADQRTRVEDNLGDAHLEPTALKDTEPDRVPQSGTTIQNPHVDDDREDARPKPAAHEDSEPVRAQSSHTDFPSSVEQNENGDGERSTEAVKPASPEATNLKRPNQGRQQQKSPSRPAPDMAAKAQERMARFKALQARAKTSSETNFKEAAREAQRMASDSRKLVALHRQREIASHKLLKAEVEEAGEDFERKRAWDWTVDESERWDKRMKKKAAHRDNNAFRDNQQESNKVYKRQLQNIKPDLERYDKEKLAAIEKAAASGGLDIVETDDGELIAVDKDGSFFSTADSTSFTQNKPDRAAVDRLVQDMRRAEDQRLKKRRERMANNGDDSDVTYINEKNKQFNQKLARFYDKYTTDIRDSFERGTMI